VFTSDDISTQFSAGFRLCHFYLTFGNIIISSGNKKVLKFYTTPSDTKDVTIFITLLSLLHLD